jgi:hypothetical protein
MVFGNIGRMLAAAAGERDGSILAAVFESGCGGVQPPVPAAVEWRGLTKPRGSSVETRPIYFCLEVHCFTERAVFVASSGASLVSPTRTRATRLAGSLRLLKTLVFC